MFSATPWPLYPRKHGTHGTRRRVGLRSGLGKSEEYLPPYRGLNPVPPSPYPAALPTRLRRPPPEHATIETCMRFLPPHPTKRTVPPQSAQPGCLSPYSDYRTCWTLEQLSFDRLHGQESLLFYKASRPELQFTQPRVRSGPVKWPEREAGTSPSSSVDGKKTGTNSPRPHTTSWRSQGQGFTVAFGINDRV